MFRNPGCDGVSSEGEVFGWDPHVIPQYGAAADADAPPEVAEAAATGANPAAKANAITSNPVRRNISTISPQNLDREICGPIREDVRWFPALLFQSRKGASWPPGNFAPLVDQTVKFVPTGHLVRNIELVTSSSRWYVSALATRLSDMSWKAVAVAARRCPRSWR